MHLKSITLLDFFSCETFQRYKRKFTNDDINVVADGYDTGHISLQWKEDSPVVFADNIFLEEFIIEKHTTKTFSSNTSTGKISVNKIIKSKVM